MILSLLLKCQLGSHAFSNVFERLRGLNELEFAYIASRTNANVGYLDSL